MSLPYQVWLRQAAYDYLDSIDVAERQRLLAWIEPLGGHPERDGDFSEPGNGGRSWHGAVVAKLRVIWWVDTPVREINVVTIRRADR
ncbi:MAG: hypothetical protein WDN28_11900 [Chthoniobacter sp.]